MNRKTWLLIFHTPEKFRNEHHVKKAPFENYASDITDDQLLEIYDTIPTSITNANGLNYVHDSNYPKLAKWMIEYKQNESNNGKIRQTFDKVYDILVRYAYWIMFKEIVVLESADETLRFYKTHGEYINLNQKELDTGNTVKSIFSSDHYFKKCFRKSQILCFVHNFAM